MADRKIRKHIALVAAFLLALIAVQILYLAKVSVWDGDELAAHPLNTRTALMEKDIVRGRIVDHEGRVLAESSADGSRSYPYGRILAPVTGYQTERYGATGVEQVEGQALSGVTADVAHMGPLRTLLRADAGYDVRLTVDAKLSEAAWNALGSRHGAVVVMDASTGAVLTMVSAPSFDPASAERHWDELSTRADSPLLNRVTQGLYPPGSTFKTLIADAALTAGVTNPDEVFTCTGELASAFERFGIGTELADTEISMAVAHVPELKQLADGEIAQIGIGQGALLVTPMQMALVADAFANGGRIMQPYLVEQVLTAQGTPLYEASPTVWRTATTAERAAVIDGWMADVVAAGTGTAADVAGVRGTGKTGTAENASGTDHAWFIGSAERGGHKIVMAVLVEEGGFGGRAAAGIARTIIQQYFEGLQ